MRRALAVAASAVEKGNHPFGAVLMVDGVVVLEAENSVVSESDATRHAELNLVALACKKLSEQERAKATLVTSTEPCAMCAGAIYWGGIRNVVFGCSHKTLEKHAGESLLMPCTAVFEAGVDKVAVQGPLLEDEAEKLHDGFWSALGEN